ncbi:putative membrane protein [Eubacterium multiforme]|uniref:Membrane protein n=1 Tax=Eubacterium multiforme TaxID=83339 RepID=A0ABT9UVL3_9FIRM|nr:putative membrane protein [Eubacterium multiforme]
MIKIKDIKFSIVLLIFMIIFTLIKNFAPPKYFVLFVILLPFIIITLGLIAFRNKNK